VQIHLDGSTAIGTTRERAYSLLTDPSFLAKTIPDAEGVEVVDSATLEARIKVRVAVVSSTLRMRMTVAEKQPPFSAKLLAEGAGSGSTLKMTSVFRLEGDSPVTMTWSAEADVGGVMAGLGSTLLKSFAAKKVEEIFGGVTTAIERTVSKG
jgi:carbon monoxide dehydrogenase subunit G